MLDSVTLFDITMKDISLNGNFFGGDSVTEAAELRGVQNENSLVGSFFRSAGA